MGGANPETSRGEQSFGYENWSCPREQENCQQVAMEGESMTKSGLSVIMHLSYIMHRFYNSIIIVLFLDPTLSLRESVTEQQFNYDMTAFVSAGGLLVKIK